LHKFFLRLWTVYTRKVEYEIRILTKALQIVKRVIDIIFVNGFNLGRYWDRGPLEALYLPGALLKEENEIIIFETDGKTRGTITLKNEPDVG